MKRWIDSLFVAMSMYSKIPVPKVDWNEGSMKYVFLFFPVVGAVIGGFLAAWIYVVRCFQYGGLLFAAVATVLPIAVTGGIHLDGLIDTSDAIHSYGDREKRLQILKDPHVGAFGVIMCGLYVILQLGIWGQLYEKSDRFILAALAFVISRTLAGLTVVRFRLAKNTGLAHVFSVGAEKKLVGYGLIFYLLLLGAFFLYNNILLGAVVIACLCLFTVWYKKMAYTSFDGITGDLTGYFLQWTELLVLGIVALWPRIGGLL